MELRRGYKQTSVGELPSDWIVRSLDELADIKSGIAKNSAAHVTNPVLVHYLRVANVQDGFLDLSEMSQLRISREDVRRYAVLPGDMLMNEGGDLDKLGRGTLWNGEFDPCVHQNHVFVVRCGSDLVPKYLNAWTGAASARRFFLLTGKQTTNLASINRTSLGTLPVPLPPTKTEQEAIAEALGDADALIESLEQLLAKKLRLKQGAMQALLTGRTRLPGFSARWVASKLGALGRFSKGRGVKKDDALRGTIPCVRYGEIYTRHNDVVRSFYSWISSEVAAGATRLQSGDLLFAGSGETKEEIGKCVAFVDPVEAYAGGDIIILRPSDSDSMFLGYCLNTPSVIQQKASRGQGDAVVHISSTALGSVDVVLPRRDEQSAIAAVLADMDAEITILEVKLTKARFVKQGMLQELLTGKIRLV